MINTSDKTDTNVDNLLGNPHKCILFNDDNHSVDEVSLQIQKAIHCNPDRAWQIMLQAHNIGSAVVLVSSLERCELVAAILEQIGLATNVEKA